MDISIFCPGVDLSVNYCFTSYTAQPFTLSFVAGDSSLMPNSADWQIAPVTGSLKVGPSNAPLIDSLLPDPALGYALSSKLIVSQNQLFWYEGYPPTYPLVGFATPAFSSFGPGGSFTANNVVATQNPSNGGNQGAYGYVGTDLFFINNMQNVSLTAADDPAPEPQTPGLVALGLGAVWFGRRRLRS